MWAILLSVMMWVPAASAEDPFAKRECVGNVCAGAASCEPALVQCRGEVTPASQCARNPAIQGQTCQGVVGVGARSGGRSEDLWIGVSFTDGHVNALNLPNTWISPSVQVGLAAAGADLGTTSVGLYRSVITADREWTNVVLVASHHDGATEHDVVLLGVRLLDDAPHGCYLDVSGERVAGCPTERDVRAILP